jgi:MoaA/NifB/PqqE/SkfB family radical SAM enzyme
MLGNDFVINENYCNQKCEYCLTGQSNLKASHKDKHICKALESDETRLHLIVDRIQQKFKTPFIKISGGEIFLNKGINSFIEAISLMHEVVIVQTNGTVFKEEYFEKFLELGNIVIQVSLDSHLHHGNSYRVSSASHHERLLNNIIKILESGLPVEIYSVLTNKNVTEMEAFASWLQEFKTQPLYFPFPIRGPEMERFKVRPDQIACIEAFNEKYDTFEPILPPQPYFTYLIDFYQNSERTLRCHLPRLVLSTFNDGVLTACPNIWFNDMGNMLSSDWKDAVSKVGHIGLYRFLLSPSRRLDACKSCYSPWDLLSLYFNDEITLDALCKSPTYAPAAIRRLIQEAKAAYDSEHCA